MANKPEYVEITAFGHRFRLLSGLADDLITLEREGAIYDHFWDDKAKTFRYYKIPFLPQEIFEYVEAHVAQQQFDDAINRGASFKKALAAITNKELADRVRRYGNYGKSKMKDGSTVDIRGCAASFYPPEIGALVCGQRRDRYKLLPEINEIDKTSLLMNMLDAFPVIARRLKQRKNKRPPLIIENEYDVQDLLFAIMRSVFDDARTEEWPPKHAGKDRRIDIVLPTHEIVVEVKIIRDTSHASSVVDELMIDIESYHAHPKCKTLLMFLWDPEGYIIDPIPLSRDLSGLRVKKDHQFNVHVLIRK